MLELVIVLTLSILFTIMLLPKAIQSLSINGLTIKDRYKDPKIEIPTQGAMLVIFSSFLSVSLSPFILKLLNRIFNLNYLSIDAVDVSVMLVISIFALYGVLDDIVDVGWWPKVLLPLCFSYPLVVFFNPLSIDVPFYGSFSLESSISENLEIHYSDIFKVVIIPVYIMVVANLVNMHSGFNGLQSGLSLILLLTLIFKSLLDGNENNLIPAVSFTGSIIVFWFYNKFPAKIFEGNIGSMTFGATIGTVIIIKEYYFFGFFILIPHTLDFLLWFYETRILKKRFLKFGKLDSMGNIVPPTAMKLKFLIPYLIKCNEKEAVNYLYLITIFFCVSGLYLFN